MTLNPENIIAPKRHDHVLLRRVLIRLTAATHLLLAIMLVVIAWLSYMLLGRMLAFGTGINYTGNQLVGADASALLQRYNPYFWWALLLICALLIAWFSVMAVRAIYARTRRRPIDAASFNTLVQQLSRPALDVLMWSWKSHDEPLSIGDLLRARNELATGRSTRLQQAAMQLAALEKARQQA